MQSHCSHTNPSAYKQEQCRGYQSLLLLASFLLTRSPSTLAVSMAVTAASYPLLPALPPALSSAWHHAHGRFENPWLPHTLGMRIQGSLRAYWVLGPGLLGQQPLPPRTPCCLPCRPPCPAPGTMHMAALKTHGCPTLWG